MVKRGLVAAVAALLIGVLISACGSSNASRATGSSADPAAIVPASTALYLAADVPDSAQLTTYRQIVTTFAGPRAWTMLSRAFSHTLSRKHLSYQQDIAPWIGAKVALAITSLQQVVADHANNGAQGLVLIFPTTDMSAAEAFAKKSIKRSSGATYVADGTYLLIGEPATLKRFETAPGAKLSSDPGYESIENSAGGDDALFYGNVHGLLAGIVSQASSQLGSSGATNPTISTLEADEAKLPADATIGLGLGVTNHAISLDVVPHDLSSAATGTRGGGGTVAGLPGDAIAAAALNLTITHQGALSQNLTKAFNELEVPAGLGGADLQAVEARAKSLLTSILPALGPLDFALSGTSILGLQAGLVMTPSSQAAATKLLTLVHSAIQRSPDAQLTGTPQNFSVALGPYTARVSDTTGKILALLGYPSASALEHPASTLAATPAYQTAVSQLPTGASVPFYLSFSSLAKLVKALDGQSAQAQRILSALNYLVLGTSSGDDRLVLGLN